MARWRFPRFLRHCSGFLSPWLNTLRHRHRAIGNRDTFSLCNNISTVLDFVFAPYSFLDITTAFIIQTAINLCAAFVIFYYLCKLFLRHIDNWYISAALVGLIFWQSIASSENFLRGQTNLIIAALLILAWNLHRDAKRPYIAGVAVAVAALLKVYFMIFIIPMLLIRPRQSFFAASAVIALAVVLSIFLFPLAGWHDWFSNIVPAGALGQNVPGAEYAGSTLNHSINGLLTRNIGNPMLIGLIGYPIIATIGLVTVYCLLRASSLPRKAAIDRGIPLLLVAIFLVSPLSWVANYVYLWIVIFALAKEHIGRRSLTATMSLLCVALLLILCLPWSRFTFGQYEKLFGILPTFAAFLLWIACCISCFRAMAPARQMSSSTG